LPNEARFRKWLDEILADSAKDIFRVKGVLAFEGKKEQFIVQGVHGIYNIQPHQRLQWKSDESPLNKLVFIGSNLDAKKISNSFKAIA